MPFRYLYLISLLLTMVASAGAQDYGKLSLHLRRMAHEHIQQVSSPTRANAAGEKAPRMVMLVRGDEEVLSPYCLTHQGDLHLCSLTVEEACELSLSPKVARIQATVSDVTTCLDTLTQIVHADQVWEGVRLPQAYTGKGVLVGVPDAGLDYTHPVFRDEKDGHLRIVRAWDKLDISKGATYDAESCFPLGKLLSDPEEILAKGHSVDSKVISHATYTTSTAAGSSAGTPYRGIAYEADIYSSTEFLSNNRQVVDSSYYKYYTHEFLLLSVSNMFAYADSVGQPCVVNYSMAFSQDMTDADVMYNEYLERLLTPGHLMVAAAGNSGNTYRYIHKKIGEEYAAGKLASTKSQSVINVSTTDSLLMRLVNVSGENPIFYDVPLDMKIGDSISTSGLKWYDFSEADTLSADFLQMSVQIYSGYDGFDSTRVGYDIFLSIAEPKKINTSNIIVQFVGKDADAEIFIQEAELTPFAAKCGYYELEYTGQPYGLGTINSPAALPCVIAVGSTSHRTNWKRYDGYKNAYAMDDPLGDRAFFSACGPSLHRYIKPDVMAPGVAVISALNSEYYKYNQSDIKNRVTLKYTPDGENEYQWAVDMGTSLSAPVVSGILALWLQADPTLTNERVKEIFAKTCRQDDIMMSLLRRKDASVYERYDHGYHWPNNECGYGEIDAYRGLLEVLGISSSIPTLSTHQLQDINILPEGQDGVRICFSEPLSSSTVCHIYSVAGQLLGSQSIREGEKEISLHLPAYDGVIAVQVEGLGSTLVRLP